MYSAQEALEIKLAILRGISDSSEYVFSDDELARHIRPLVDFAIRQGQKSVEAAFVYAAREYIKSLDLK